MSAEPSSEPKWRRLPEERPQQILDAALVEFGERGLASARLEDIAKRAGVSKGTIYLYFPNKEELFREVIRHNVIAAIANAERSFEEGGDPVVALRDWMAGYWTWLRSPVYPMMYRLITAEANKFPDVAQFYFKEAIERAHKLVCTLIERGMDEGTFRRMDPLVAGRMMTSTFVTHAMWWHQRGFFDKLRNIDAETLLQQMQDFFFNAMRPDLGDATPA